MKRWMSALLALTLLFTASVAARSEEKTYDQIVDLLKTSKVGKVKFDDVPLTEVISYLAGASGVNFVLTDALVEADVEVSLNLKDGSTVYEVLQVLVKLEQLKLMSESGVVLVLQEDDYTYDETYLEVYDISIVNRVRPTDFAGPEINMNSKQNDGGDYYDASAGGGDSGDWTPEEVKNLIVKFTGGKSWAMNEKVKIEVRGNLLLVVQSADVHFEIRDLLSRLGE